MTTSQQSLEELQLACIKCCLFVADDAVGREQLSKQREIGAACEVALHDLKALTSAQFALVANTLFTKAQLAAHIVAGEPKPTLSQQDYAKNTKDQLARILFARLNDDGWTRDLADRLEHFLQTSWLTAVFVPSFLARTIGSLINDEKKPAHVRMLANAVLLHMVPVVPAAAASCATPAAAPIAAPAVASAAAAHAPITAAPAVATPVPSPVAPQKIKRVRVELNDLVNVTQQVQKRLDALEDGLTRDEFLELGKKLLPQMEPLRQELLTLANFKVWLLSIHPTELV